MVAFKVGKPQQDEWEKSPLPSLLCQPLCGLGAPCFLMGRNEAGKVKACIAGWSRRGSLGGLRLPSSHQGAFSALGNVFPTCAAGLNVLVWGSVRLSVCQELHNRLGITAPNVCRYC